MRLSKMKYIVFFAVVIFCSVSCKRDNEPQSNINTEIPLYNIIGYSYTKCKMNSQLLEYFYNDYPSELDIETFSFLPNKKVVWRSHIVGWDENNVCCLSKDHWVRLCDYTHVRGEDLFGDKTERIPTDIIVVLENGTPRYQFRVTDEFMIEESAVYANQKFFSGDCYFNDTEFMGIYSLLFQIFLLSDDHYASISDERSVVVAYDGISVFITMHVEGEF